MTDDVVMSVNQEVEAKGVGVSAYSDGATGERGRHLHVRTETAQIQPRDRPSTVKVHHGLMDPNLVLKMMRNDILNYRETSKGLEGAQLKKCQNTIRQLNISLRYLEHNLENYVKHAIPCVHAEDINKVDEVREDAPKVREMNKLAQALGSPYLGPPKDKTEEWLTQAQYYTKKEYEQLEKGDNINLAALGRDIKDGMPPERVKALAQQLIRAENASNQRGLIAIYRLGQLAEQERKRMKHFRGSFETEFCIRILGRSLATVKGYISVYQLLTRYPKLKRIKMNYTAIKNAKSRIDRVMQLNRDLAREFEDDK